MGGNRNLNCLFVINFFWGGHANLIVIVNVEFFFWFCL